MKDCMGREIEYLRLSVTDRCNLRCVYCRDGSEQCNKEKELTVNDIDRIIKSMVFLGVNKVRLTGGEPLMRPDLEMIVKKVAQNSRIKDLCMTTNGQGLSYRVKALKEAGLMRLNISVDSLDAARYNRITRGGKIEEVIRGIDEAITCGLYPIKLNAVIVRGENDDEIDDFIALTKDRPIDVRFIELMPIGKLGQNKENRVPSSEILESRPYLKRVMPRYPSQPSEDYKVEGYQGRVGFISPMSHKFCNICNRIRLTSDGQIKPCLGNNGEVSLKNALLAGADMLTAVIRKTIFNKPEGHNFDKKFASDRIMSRIGG